jgi:hypothetical protein
MIMFIFGTTVGIASNMQEEATDRLIMKAAKMRCIGLANILEEISANGPGASVSFAVNGNYSLAQGLIKSADAAGDYCIISPDTVVGNVSLTKRTYVIKNGNGSILFT